MPGALGATAGTLLGDPEVKDVTDPDELGPRWVSVSLPDRPFLARCVAPGLSPECMIVLDPNEP
jgi:hypothetical protein